MHRLVITICLVLCLPMLGATRDQHDPGRRFLLQQQPVPDGGGEEAADAFSVPDVMLAAGRGLCGAPCAVGYFCSPENNSCVKCQRGFFNNEVVGTKKCWRCEHGWTTTDEGSTTCPVCAPGFGGPTCSACTPGSFSLGLTEDRAPCQPCSNPAINECQQQAHCDPRTGTSRGGFVPNGRSCKGGRGSCWRGKCVCPAGFQGDDCSEPCPPNTMQNGRMSECAACKQVKPGPCVEAVTCTADKGNVFTYRPPGTPCGAAGIGRCSSRGTCACPAGTGGDNCAACEPFTWSPGLSLGQPCQACPSIAVCRCLPGPCERLPPCDPATGQPVPGGPCTVPKPDGTVCNPRSIAGRLAADAVWPSCAPSRAEENADDDGAAYACHAGVCEAGFDVDACAGFPCSDGEQGGVATCVDLPPPAPNDASGRRCSCSDGFTYTSDAAGCVKA